MPHERQAESSSKPEAKTPQPSSVEPYPVPEDYVVDEELLANVLKNHPALTREEAIEMTADPLEHKHSTGFGFLSGPWRSM